jgi:hypothetical protein
VEKRLLSPTLQRQVGDRGIVGLSGISPQVGSYLLDCVSTDRGIVGLSGISPQVGSYLLDCVSTDCMARVLERVTRAFDAPRTHS